MEMKKTMRYRVPDYYQQFVCLAGACPETCCAGWQIEIDEKSLIKYIRYQKEGGSFGTRLFNGVDWKEGVFRQGADKRCEFLNDENLCDIYSQAGKEMLCRTCRTYPRHIEEFKGIREISLSLSCPEAARIILEKKEPVRFIEQRKGGAAAEEEEFDSDLFIQLLRARKYLLEVIQNRSVPTTDRIAKALLYAHDFQLCIKRNELEKHGRILQAHRQSGFGERYQKLLSKKRRREEKDDRLFPRIWQLFRDDLEVLKETWPDYLDQCINTLYGRGAKDYQQWKERFQTVHKSWETECEQLMVYWIYTYFLGAVYDGNAYANLKLAVVSTILIREMSIAGYIEREGVLSKQDQIDICLRYSREIEHSDTNLRRVERMMCKNELFCLDNLLRIL